MSIIGDHLTEDNSGMYGSGDPEKTALRRQLAALEHMNQQMRAELQTAVYRINDMLHEPDGQSFKEARKWVDRVCYVHGLKNEPQPKGESNG